MDSPVTVPTVYPNPSNHPGGQPPLVPAGTPDCPRPVGRRTSQSSSHWPRLFVDGQPLEPKSHNKSYVNILKEQWEEQDAVETNERTGDELEDSDEEEPEELGSLADQDPDADTDHGENEAAGESDGPENPEDHCFARVFMRGRTHQRSVGDPEKYPGQFHRVESFCAHIRLDSLTEEHAGSTESASALLHEQSGKGKVRGSVRPMKACQLYKAWNIPRYADMDDAAAPSQGSRRLPDAAQRRLYIHNLDPESAITLMATASVHEVQSVRDLIYQHLSREPEVAAIVPTIGFRTFTFRVGIPYYALRNRPSNRKLLRRSLSIPLGDRPGYQPLAETQMEYLHESQTTISLTGFDDKNWTIIGLIDSPDEVESARHYHSMKDGRFVPDPIARGDILFDGTNKNPRLYLLKLWGIRIAQAANEYKGIVSCVEQSVRRSREEEAFAIGPLHAHAPEKSERLRNEAYTNRRLESCVKLLKDDIAKIIDVWNQFEREGIKFFQEDGNTCPDASEMRDALGLIKEIHAKLGLSWQVLERLDNSIMSSNNLHNVLVADNNEFSQRTNALAREHMLMTKSQQEAGEFLRRLSNTSMVFLPLVLTSGLFSMTPAVLPFTPSVMTFWCSLVILVIMTLLLVNFLDVIYKRVRGLTENFPKRQRVLETDLEGQSGEAVNEFATV